ncbi:hypothetical protein GY45DRAFT_451328 [Cubamyces sp. BRFM 1775]|nr:hypothetical protein GY45DRAFT_451328 [Cubamyces sp. BRFM 1775]
MFNLFSRHHCDRSSDQDRPFQRPMEDHDATRYKSGADENGPGSVGLGIAGMSLWTPFDHAAPPQSHSPPPIHPPMRAIRPIWGDESMAAASNQPGDDYEHYAYSYDEEHAATPNPPKRDDLLRKPIDIPQYSEVLARRHAQCRPQRCYWDEESTCTKTCPPWAPNQLAAVSDPSPLPFGFSSPYNPQRDPRIMAGGNLAGWQGPQPTQMPTAQTVPWCTYALPYVGQYQNAPPPGMPCYYMGTAGFAMAAAPMYYRVPQHGVWNNGAPQYSAPGRPCEVTADGWPISDPPPPYGP